MLCFFAIFELAQALQSECGSSDKSRACGDDVNRHPFHSVFEASFSGEGLHELRLLQ